MKIMKTNRTYFFKHSVSSLSGRAQCLRKENGLVLIVTLLVLVIMTLASIGLIRTIDTSNFTAKNYSLTSSCEIYAMPPIEGMIQTLAAANFDGNALYGTTGESLPDGYSPKFLDGDNEQGIPKCLLGTTVGASCSGKNGSGSIEEYTPPSDITLSDGTSLVLNNKAYVVAERMCNQIGAPDATHCLGVKGSSSNDNDGAQVNVNTIGKLFVRSGAGLETTYRITARVNCPNNTVSFEQVMINL
jgi:Tfp pilus assembly protein PilX